MRTNIAAHLVRMPSRPARWLVWCGGAIAIGALGMIRVSTDAEYLFFSLAIIPVIVVSWITGLRGGAALSILAAAMWAGADLLAGRQFSANWIPVVNAVTQLATYSLVGYLAATMKTLLARERQMARHDALTGLLNRRAFFEIGQAEAARLKRYERSLAIIFLDLDDFKQLNDSLGHQAGDAALLATANTLKQTLRATDHLARLGGDEFAMLLPEIAHDAAIEAGKKVAAATKAALKQFPPTSTSLGVAWFELPVDFPAMLAAADKLMYAVKAEGKHGMKTQAFRAGASGLPRYPDR